MVQLRKLSMFFVEKGFAREKEMKRARKTSRILAFILSAVLVSGSAGGGSFTVKISALSYVNSLLKNPDFTERGQNAVASLYSYYKAAMAVQQ